VTVTTALAVLFALTSVSPGHAPATNATEVSKVAPSIKEAATLALARHLFTEDTQVAAVERLFDTQIADSFRKERQVKALEARYPGFTAALLGELKPAFISHTRASVPKYQARVASLVASHLSEEDIQALSAFYESPSGRKIRMYTVANASTVVEISEPATGPENSPRYELRAKDDSAAATTAVETLDMADRIALLEFQKTPHYRRYVALEPAVRQLDREFAIETEPELSEKISAAFRATIARFGAGADS
jgi:hypothetical protein